MRQIGVLGLMLLLSGCAVLHRAQFSDIDSAKGERLSLKISETTIDLKEIGEIAKFAGNTGKSAGLLRAGNAIDTYSALFQFGPRTGTPVYTENYARGLPNELEKKCEGGRLSNVVSVRETASYPIVKGEIVRVEATCIK